MPTFFKGTVYSAMSFESLPEFLAMGGHGLYVWLSYGATIVVVLANVVVVRRSRQRYLRELADVERRQKTAELAR